MNTSTKLPIWFWIVTVLALLYFLMDTWMFYMRAFMLEDFAKTLPEQRQTFFSAMPTWVTGVFGMEALGGLMGSIALITKRKWAFILFCISMIGVLAQSSYIWFASNALEVMGESAIFMPVVAIVFGIVMIMLSRHAINRGWIR